jgi:tRNA A37 threonylcarbamoyladenosine biosynthesis protein TsaE
LYHTGDEGMACYSVDEKASGINTTMTSISFGTVRKYKNSRQTIYLHLQMLRYFSNEKCHANKLAAYFTQVYPG